MAVWSARGLVRAVVCLAMASGCGETSLAWNVTFETDDVRMRASSARAVVVEGPCGGAGRVWYDELVPRGAAGPSVPSLQRGTHCFAVHAFDARCQPIGAGCGTVALPAPGGTVIETVVRAAEGGCGSAAPPACADAGALDAGPPDAGPPEPIVVARGGVDDAVASTLVDVPVGEPTVALVTGTTTGHLSSAGSGVLVSGIRADGIDIARSLTSRDGLMNEQLHAASAALFARPISPAQFALADEAVGYTAMPYHSIAYALLTDRLVDHGVMRADGRNTTTASIDVAESSLVLFHGWYRAVGAGRDRYVGVALAVDGTPCVETELGSEIWNDRDVQANALCLAVVDAGTHLLDAAGQRRSADTDGHVELGWAAFPSRLATVPELATFPVPPETNPADFARPVVVDAPSALVAVGSGAFRGGGGWHDLYLAVDSAECARTRNFFPVPGGDLAVSVACVVPVEPGEVSLSIGTLTEGLATTRSLTLRYVLLPAVE